MINCLFFSVVIFLFMSFSFGGMTYSSIHRTFLNMHRSILEVSVVTVGNNGEDVNPYFNESLLETYVVNYLADNISKYSTIYNVSVIYFDRETNEINTNHRANGASISLEAKINTFYQYKHAREFTINERGHVL